MTPSARLATTIEALTEIRATPRPADTIMSAFFRSRRFIGAKDRAAMADTIYRILRSEARLSWWLTRVEAEIEGRSLVLADALLNERIPLNVLDDLCSGGKYAADRLSGLESVWTRKLSTHTIDHPHMPDAARLECPDWAWDKMQAAFGPRTEDVLGAMLTYAPLDLRANTLKSDRDTLLAEMKKLSWRIEKTRYAPSGLRLQGRPNLNAHPALSTGLAEIQDEGSQLVALAAGAKPGMRVLDFCAGAGGKTLAMAATMENKGRIVACDVLEGRLKKALLRFRRAGAHNIEIQPISSESDAWLKRHKGSFDRVLVDAPCSGTGTWRRNPDARWKNLGPGLDELLKTQASILDSAARLVKPNGRLIYATCSLLPDENQNQVKSFLDRHKDYRLVPVAQVWAEDANADAPLPEGADDMLTLDPARHKTDGFFAAVLERLPAAAPEAA